jgi:hypothetical protein
MSKVIQFPDTKQRVAFKRNVAKNKRGNFFKAVLQTVRKILSGVFFSIRLGTATALHVSSLVVLGILDKLTLLLFFLIALGCVITYFHLGRNFTSPTNYAIPFFTCFWIFCCSTPHIATMIQEQSPFHRMLRVN